MTSVKLDSKLTMEDVLFLHLNFTITKISDGEILEYVPSDLRGSDQKFGLGLTPKTENPSQNDTSYLRATQDGGNINPPICRVKLPGPRELPEASPGRSGPEDRSLSIAEGIRRWSS